MTIAEYNPNNEQKQIRSERYAVELDILTEIDVTALQTDRETDKPTHPIIEMQSRIQKHPRNYYLCSFRLENNYR